MTAKMKVVEEGHERRGGQTQNKTKNLQFTSIQKLLVGS